MSILYKTTRFADTFTGDKETNVRVQLLSWDTLDTKAFVEYLATKYNLSKGEAYKSLSIVPVSYTHLDVYKRQDGSCLICHDNTIKVS